MTSASVAIILNQMITEKKNSTWNTLISDYRQKSFGTHKF